MPAVQPSRELCWNCQSASDGHIAANCPHLGLSSEQWDSLEQKFGHPAPGDPRHRRNGITCPGPVPQYREPCCNCWASRNHRAKNCPNPQLSIFEREKLRVQLKAQLYAFWEEVLNLHGVLPEEKKEKAKNTANSKKIRGEERKEKTWSAIKRDYMTRALPPLPAVIVSDETGAVTTITKGRRTNSDAIVVASRRLDNKPKTRKRSKTVGEGSARKPEQPLEDIPAVIEDLRARITEMMEAFGTNSEKKDETSTPAPPPRPQTSMGGRIGASKLPRPTTARKASGTIGDKPKRSRSAP